MAAYLGDATVDAICETHHLGLVRLYRVLDRHRIPRRRPNAPRIDRRRVKLILADYATDLTVDQVAAKHGVSTSTVSRLAQRAGILRVPYRERDELVDLVVRWFLGEPLDTVEVDVIARIGCRVHQRGLRALADLEPGMRRDVALQVVAEIADRYIDRNTPETLG